jgi:hypothetical protein
MERKRSDFLACLWEIWKYRNAVIFRVVRLTTRIVVERMVQEAEEW